MVYGLVAPGYEMAEVAAANLDRASRGPSPGFDMSTKLKLMGVDVASFGDPFAEADGTRALTFEDPFGGVYKKLVFDPDGTRLLGGILVGDASDYGTLLGLFKSDEPLPVPPGELLLVGREPRPAAAASVGRRPGLLVQQRRRASDPRGDPRPEADDRRAGQGVHARPAPAAAAACRWSPTCSRPSSRRRARRSTTGSASTSRYSRQELFQIVDDQADQDVRRLDRLARPAATAARSASRPSPRSWRASGTRTSSTRPTRRSRTPTTASWPTSSAAACTRSSRASPAARSRPRS